MTRVRVVAEIGVAHQGSMVLAKDMIHRAKLARADYCKFQYFHVSELGVNDELAKKLKEVTLTLDELEELKAYAASEGIGFFVTPMATIHTLEQLVNRLNPPIIKIREADGRKDEFVNAAAATGKTLLISVDPRKGPYLPPNRNSFLMYCLAQYPPRTADFNHTLAGRMMGFSNHFPHTTFAKISVREARSMGQDIYWLEVHVLPSRNFDCLDKRVSITFEELAEVCSYSHRERSS